MHRRRARNRDAQLSVFIREKAASFERNHQPWRRDYFSTIYIYTYTSSLTDRERSRTKKKKKENQAKAKTTCHLKRLQSRDRENSVSSSRCRWFPLVVYSSWKSRRRAFTSSPPLFRHFLMHRTRRTSQRIEEASFFHPLPFHQLRFAQTPPFPPPSLSRWFSSRRRKTDEGVVRGGLRSFHYFSRNAISGIIELGQLAGELSAERLFPNWSFVKDTLPVWKAVLYAMAIRLAGGWKASISSAKLVIWKPSPRCGRRGSNLINVKMLKVTSVIN